MKPVIVCNGTLNGIALSRILDEQHRGILCHVDHGNVVDTINPFLKGFTETYYLNKHFDNINTRLDKMDFNTVGKKGDRVFQQTKPFYNKSKY